MENFPAIWGLFWTGYKKCCPYFQGPAVSNANGSAPPSGAPSSGGGLDKEKEIRKLQKKLDDIAKLKAKKAAGENLEVNQVQKIDKEAELVAEMKKLKAWNFFSINPHLYLKLSGTFGKITYFDFRGVSCQKQFDQNSRWLHLTFQTWFCAFINWWFPKNNTWNRIPSKWLSLHLAKWEKM